MPEIQPFKITATFTCRVCGAKESASCEIRDAPGTQGFFPPLPEKWKYSHGASGRGQYFQCSKCIKVLIDDSGPGVCLDYAYYQD